jgi:hypothetical protein
VDTLVVAPTGSLVMGTPANSIPPNFTAKITFTDRGPIDTHWDPNLMSRGLLSHGVVTMYGAETTPYVALAQPAMRGNTQLVLAQVPTNWKVGDRLIVTGTSATANQDEDLRILGIAGNQVTVRPLTHNHAAPAGLSLYVANVTRNVVLESENSQTVSRRGHAMLMHVPSADVNYVGLYGLGRTDKKTPVNDPLLDVDGHLIPGTGSNPRARYALHFHRTGITDPSRPALARGNAVVGSPGWGFVNHSSNVVMENNVAFNVDGAAFTTETGDEIGAFRRNLAIRSIGSGHGLESRNELQDFGHQGDGFWFQGGGVSVEDNIAVGQRHTGFIYFTRGLVERDLGTRRFLAANLPDRSWANGEETVDVGNVPIRSFQRNVSYASGDGFESWFHLLNARHPGRSVIQDFTVWNTRNTRGMHIPYTNQATLRNVWLVGNLSSPRGTAVDANDVTRNIVYENLRLEGWAIGIRLPIQGTARVQGGYFNNTRNLVIPPSLNTNRVIEITGNIQFAAGNQTDISVTASLTPRNNDLTLVFNRDTILVQTPQYNGQLYAVEQAPNFVPFPQANTPTYVPAELIGKTNAQLFQQYGLAIGGVPAPANAATAPRIQGLLGGPVAQFPNLTLSSRKYTNQLQNYRLTYRNASNQLIRETQRVNLRQGWNLLTRTIEGQARTFLVFGDVTPPTFQVNANQRLEVRRTEVGAPFILQGTFNDNSTGPRSFSMTFRNLASLPLQTRANGSQYLVLRFEIRDSAGNATIVQVELNVI